MKRTKKIISLILAVMMVLTAFPMSAFADDLATKNDETAKTLADAIDFYEQVMTGDVYFGMADAYKAYVDTQAAYDAYVYGGNEDVKANAKSIANNLVSKTDAMRTKSAWQPFTGTKKGSFAQDTNNPEYQTPFYYNQVYNNLLWVKSPIDGSEWTGELQAGTDMGYTAQVKFGVDDVTMLYDGKSAPSFGMSLRVLGVTKPRLWDWSHLRFHYAFVASSEEGVRNADGLQFVDAWHGVDGNAENFQWNYFAPKHVTGATNYEQTYTYYEGAHNKVFANIMKFTPAGAYPFGRDESLLLELNPIIYFNIGNDKANNSHSHQLTHTIRVFNYAKISKTVNAQTALLSKVKNYKQGGLTEVMEAFDKLTVDPNSFFTSSNNYEACVNHYAEPVEYLASITENDLQKDETQYQSLRNALTRTDATSKISEEQKALYTPESWSAFDEAYTNAKNFASLINTDKYGDGQTAGELATALDNAYDNLEITYVPVDTVDLEGAIDDAKSANVNKVFFTKDSYQASNLEENTPKAIIAVWGAEDKYGVKDAKLVYTKENQELVDQWTETVGEGVAKLVIDIRVPLASAGLYSLESALAQAETYKPEDFGNYMTLSSAMTAARNFEKRVIVDTTDTSKLQAGMVSKKVNEYTKLVNDLYLAMRNLKPAFSKVKNGTIASSKDAILRNSHIHKSNTQWWLNWSFQNENIIFRTTHDETEFDLGKSNFEWNCSRKFDQYLETMNFDSNPDFVVGELTSNKDYTGEEDYSGKLEVGANGQTIRWSNFIVNSTNIAPDNDFIGKDINGNGYKIESKKVWDDELLKFQTSYKNPCSGIIVHGDGDSTGSTYFSADTTLEVQATPKKTLSASTRPTLMPCTASGWWGSYFFYEWSPTFVSHYAGYAYMQIPYEYQIYIVDISYLLELIDLCSTYEYKNYTEPTWNNFVTALEAANANMDYQVMSSDVILSECVNRYNNLWKAKNALVEAATNDSIDNALAPARTIKANVEAGAEHYSPASYTAFIEAFNAAVDAINGEYSDENCRQLLKDEYQDIIDSIANDLVVATENLVPGADFSPVDNAVATKIMDKVHKTSDLDALNTQLGTFKYLTMTDAERAEVFADEQEAINAEADEIIDLMTTLAESTPVDVSTLEALKADIDAKVSDPDAYDGIEAAKQFIDDAIKDENLYKTVNVYGQDVIGINYTQDETDKLVADALTMLSAKKYTVYLKIDDGEEMNMGSYGYGDVYTYDFGEEVDIYTSYKSLTASGAQKYYGTESEVSFVVNGDTHIVAKTADKTTSYKVTVVNALTNRVISIDYVDASKGKFVLPAAPQIAYYKFANFTVNDKAYVAGEEIAVTGETYVMANYELDTAPTFNLDIMFDAGDNEIVGLYYEDAMFNNKIAITQEGLEHFVSKKEGAYFTVEGETIMETGRNAVYKGNDRDIYAYAVVDTVNYSMEDFEEMYPYFNEGYDYIEGKQIYSAESQQFPGSMVVVSYGQDYTFFQPDNMTVIALTEVEYGYCVEAGLIETDENGADITVTNPISMTGKNSIITTYSVNPDAKYVEGGILMTTSLDKDLTFNNVDGKSVFRLKSTEQTVGNQFVISIVKGGQSRDVKYVSYVIYEIDGTQYTIFSDAIETTLKA